MDINMEENQKLNRKLLVIFKWSLKLIPMILAGLQGFVSIVRFNIHTNKYDYINSIVHEAEHVKQAMLAYYNIEDEGENAAYAIAYIATKMLQLIVFD